jgi:alkaline phosphatase D
VLAAAGATALGSRSTWAQDPAAPPASSIPPRKIVFASCCQQNRPQPIWKSILAYGPETFVWLGDAIYGDTEDMNVLRAKWRQLAEQPDYARLRTGTRVLGVWDDHDYGVNDGGAEYPRRAESLQLFLDFLDEPPDSPRRTQGACYDAPIVGPPGRRVQFLLLDTRSNRSPLVKGFDRRERGEGYSGEYSPNLDPTTTVLGDAQWAWLEAQLRRPAELRLVCSSIQFVADDHGWEKWGLFPHERTRFLKLIRSTAAGGVVFVSGDRHHAEISRLEPQPDGPAYPLIDVTSSSLNQGRTPRREDGLAWMTERNRHRVGSIFPGDNFGTLEIDWEAADPVVRMQIRDRFGTVMLQERFPLSLLHPKS